MPRLTDPDTASYPDDVRALLTSLPPDPMVRMLSHSAGTVKPFVQLAKALSTSLTLPARSRELVILAVAEYTGSPFVAAQHTPMAQTAGVEERTRQLIRDRRLDAPELSPADRALLRFTAQVVRQPRVDDEVFEQARAFLTDRELVEVLQLVGYYWSFGRVSTTLDVEVTKIYGDQPVLNAPGDSESD
ncbi:carboxymuconolactone decarboxylase family protein [Streptomyces sp. E5N91]|uniref:carboxymuconolactone decarboxylase family protein n=1 Tax=Streptomyces sp. E5N91 TaxID=1851996 RepID=UPI000EF56804|nr:carboxymuconolactone decarboxylase family protein [Streptomyces sp. E5N91]